MKNIIEDYNSTISMTKKSFLCILSILSSPTMMSVTERHVTIMVKLTIGYDTVMKKKLTFRNLKQISILNLRLVSFVNQPTLWKRKVIMENMEKTKNKTFPL
jgi:hypothetical protein